MATGLTQRTRGFAQDLARLWQSRGSMSNQEVRPAAAKGLALGCFAAIDFARGRLYDTTDVDEARDVAARVFQPHRLDLVGAGAALSARLDHVPVGPMSINRLTWGTRVRVDPDRLDTYYLVSIPVRGAANFRVGRHAMDVSPRRAGVISPSHRFRFETDASFEQVLLRLEQSAVEDAWTALTGRPPAGPLELDPSLPLGGAAWQAMEPALRLLAACACGGYDPQVLPHVQHRVHDMLLAGMLLHMVPALASPPAAPARGAAALVRRAQDWLWQRLDAPLTVGEAARASGVAARTLQAAFHSECGMGPMQWLREERLAAVHRALLDADNSAAGVADTAFSFGFTHLGEFGRAYRARFGEAPSRTRMRRG